MKGTDVPDGKCRLRDSPQVTAAPVPASMTRTGGGSTMSMSVVAPLSVPRLLVPTTPARAAVGVQPAAAELSPAVDAFGVASSPTQTAFVAAGSPNRELTT